MSNLTHSLLQYAKVFFYNKLRTDYNPETVTAPGEYEGEVVLEDSFTGVTLANVTLYTPYEETLRFVRVAWPRYLKPTLALGYLDLARAYFKKGYPYRE